MTNWSIATHGDGREQRHWPIMSKLVPNYEVFWAAYVAPQTFRILDPEVILMRPDASHAAIANANYSLFTHLANAVDVLEDDPELDDSESIYSFVSRLYSATDAVEDLVRPCGAAMGDFGPAKFPDVEQWMRGTKNAAVWEQFHEIDKTVRSYRAPFVHATEPIRIDGKLPKTSAIGSYTDLGKLAEVVADPTMVDRDFEPGGDVGAQLRDGLCAAIDAVWAFLIHQFQGLARHNDFLRRLEEVSDADRARLLALQARLKPKAPSPAPSGVVPPRMPPLSGGPY